MSKEIKPGDRVRVSGFDGEPAPGEDGVMGRVGTVERTCALYAWVHLDEVPNWWQDEPGGLPFLPEELEAL